MRGFRQREMVGLSRPLGQAKVNIDPQMIRHIVNDLRDGKRVVVVTGSELTCRTIGEMVPKVWARIDSMVRAPAKGQIMLLCAEVASPGEWKKHRFDTLHAEAGVLDYPGGRELLEEAKVRTGTQAVLAHDGELFDLLVDDHQRAG